MVSVHNGDAARMINPKEDAARARINRAFPERTGNVLRGKLTALYDEKYGRYDAAKDAALPVTALAEQRIVYGDAEISRAMAINRLDVLAEALFLGGTFEIKGPWRNIKYHRFRTEYDYGNFAGIRLSHPERQGMLIVDADLEGSSRHNRLFISAQNSASLVLALHISDSSRIEVLTRDMLQSLAYLNIFANAQGDIASDVSGVNYKTLREAFEGLCEKLGVKGLSLTG